MLPYSVKTELARAERNKNGVYHKKVFSQHNGRAVLESLFDVQRYCKRYFYLHISNNNNINMYTTSSELLYTTTNKLAHTTE